MLEILKVCIATFPVPLLGLLLYRKKILKSIFTITGFLALIFGVAEMFLLTNGNTGDFSWGYDLSVGVATMVTLGESMNEQEDRWKRIPLFSVFVCQLVIGFYYIVRVYQGGIYWI